MKEENKYIGALGNLSFRARWIVYRLIDVNRFDEINEMEKNEIEDLFKNGIENGSIPENLAKKVKNCGKKTEIEIKTFFNMV